MKMMRFEGRDLTPYAEPVSASALREGQVYFFVYYSDEEMCTPLMETVAYVGRYINSEGAERLRFQDVNPTIKGHALIPRIQRRPGFTIAPKTA